MNEFDKFANFIKLVKNEDLEKLQMILWIEILKRDLK
jgi:hypothetical protein